jgi:hypothetical protein
LGFACEVLPGFGEQHLTMRVDGNEVWFSPEDSFWHISIAGESEWASRVAEAICSNLSSASGLTGKVIPI